ncbi:bifunctional glycoside hydrolase 114/ polysaccharide deacetylase family protein [Pistricoccus aurantiacus]|uniref:bifunctional glycoside hydrolase 114/ polysaccharide deacetylase family protein n=1 Tax=Pistricoccus aurantiacus TaxID=1883414 RepID=UPI00362747AF
MMNKITTLKQRWLLAALICLTFTLTWESRAMASEQPSVAFYYGNDIPFEQLDQFDWVVIEADSMAPGDQQRLARNGAQVFAYLSVGELEQWRKTTAPPPESSLMMDNPDWPARVADLTNPDWQEYLFEERVTKLWEQGYRAFFLDTLDSYQFFARDGEEAAVQQTALVDIIQRLHERFPGIKLLLNRGFEVLDRVQDDIVGVAAESLYRRWNPSTGVYGNVPEEDSDWLLNQLTRIQDEYDLPVIAIDYVPAADREVARETARRIHEQGLIPWVSVPELNQVGVGLIEPVPRRALVFYNSKDVDDGMLSNTAAYQTLGVPLEYLGFAVEYRDVNEPLPEGVLNGRYAGILTWFQGPLEEGQQFGDWLSRQMQQGSKVAIFGALAFPLSGELSRMTGLQRVDGFDSATLEITDFDEMMGYEGMPDSPEFFQGGFRSRRESNKLHLTLEDAKGVRLSPVITGDWGGIAVSPWEVQNIGSQQRWLLDPFAFLKNSLDLPTFPVPDTTTENGSRFWTTQIDGDAFISHAEFPGAPYTGEIMLEEVLKRYDVPTTVSIVEGEFGPKSVRPQDGPELEPLAREIFALPWIELATHTFSHPFEWHKLKEGDLAGQGKTKAGFHYNLPLEGYRYSLEREIVGSANYIDRRLAPPGKRTEVVLWSGNALPPEKALAIIERNGMVNFNGGNTSITRDNPSLTQVSPMLRPVGDYLQVNAPIINENVYTNEMTSPLWGYRRVIETFQLTDMPRRLKPISIYYHFYSAGTPAALRALKQVYDYVLEQETLPVYVSTWSKLATSWYDVGVARHLDGSWRISGTTKNRTLRIPTELGWPDFARSSQVAGVRDIPQGRYVALSGADHARLVLDEEPPRSPYLKRANGRLTDWQAPSTTHKTMTLSAEEVALVVELGATQGCRVNAPGASFTSIDDGVLLNYDHSGPATIEVSCD